MLRFLADENFNNHLLNCVQRDDSEVDILRVQDAGLSGIPDPEILEWAAQESRILLTHDARTMTRFAYERVAAGLALPGVFVVTRRVFTEALSEEICILARCSLPNEWEGQVRHLPML